MPSNRGVVYLGPGKVAVQNIDYPRFSNPAGKPINHGAILKVVATNICGSDQHMVRGRTTAPAGMVLGHEVTGEIIEIGSDVEYHKIGISFRFRSIWLAAAAEIVASNTRASA
jgi:glutathione-independent formaldehyde dehydrogenase